MGHSDLQRATAMSTNKRERETAFECQHSNNQSERRKKKKDGNKKQKGMKSNKKERERERETEESCPGLLGWAVMLGGNPHVVVVEVVVERLGGESLTWAH